MTCSLPTSIWVLQPGSPATHTCCPTMCLPSSAAHAPAIRRPANVTVSQGQPLTLDLPLNENDVYLISIDP